MKNLKTFFATLALLLCCGSASAHDFEVDGIYYNITSSSDLTAEVTYRGSSYKDYSNEYSGSVVIPESVTYNSKTYCVTSIGNHAFYYCSRLTSVTIPNSVTSIGDYTFYNCRSLTSVTIPDGVTSIGSYAFYGCNSLTSVTIPDGVTSVGSSAFNYCSSLTSVTIPNSITSIGDYAFSCSGLTSVTIPNSVTSIGYMAFQGCSSLTSVTIGDGVTSIGDYAFEKCSNLTSVHISDIAAWCNIKFSSSGSNPLYYAKHLYMNGKEITELKIPDGVTSIGDYVFYNCSSLTSATIPNSVTSIGWDAFYNCSSLTSVTIGDGVTSIGYSAFNGCSSLTSVTIPDGVTSIGDYTFLNCSSLTSVTIGDGVTSIGKGAFRGCSSLTSVTIGNSVTSIGSQSFIGCSNLTSVHISDIAAWCNINFSDKESNPLIYAKHLFIDGKEITELIIPDGVTRIADYVFRDCSSLTSVTIPNSVTSIGDSAFDLCSSLTSVTIGDGVTSIGKYAFNLFSNSLTSVHISDIAAWCNIKFSHFTSNPLNHAKHLYMNGKEITELVIPDGVTSIGDYTFCYCSSLTSVTIPDGVTSIGDYTFYYCRSLTSITIPNSVTSIGSSAFYNCSSLTSITIGNGVTEIGWEAFAFFGNIENVYCFAEIVPNTDETAFNKSYQENTTLHVPAASINSYKSTAPWSSFGKIVALNDEDEPVVPEPEKCATPTISYINGELMFESETEGVVYHSTITDTDIKSYETNKVQLNVTYNISVYATKEGYKDSEVAKATLCWIDVEPKSEGLTNTDIANVKALPVIVQTSNGTITVTGANDGTMVEVYGISGTKLGEAKTAFNTATINTDAQTGSIVIVKVGNKAIKIKI